MGVHAHKLKALKCTKRTYYPYRVAVVCYWQNLVFKKCYFHFYHFLRGGIFSFISLFLHLVFLCALHWLPVARRIEYKLTPFVTSRFIRLSLLISMTSNPFISQLHIEPFF